MGKKDVFTAGYTGLMNARESTFIKPRARTEALAKLE